jgi:hypothetical protein
LNFLVKIEDAINNLILLFLAKIKAILPHFIFKIVPTIKVFFSYALHFIMGSFPLIKKAAKYVSDYLKQYISSGIGYITEYSIYLRTDEFKHNKFSIIIKIYKHCVENPASTLINFAIVSFVSFASFTIFTNTQTVLTGTNKARTPASVHSTKESFESENILELKNHKFEVALKAAGGGHGGAAGGHHEEEIFFDLKIETSSHEYMVLLEEMEEKLDVELEAFQFGISGLPLSEEEKKSNETALLIYLNHEFHDLAHVDIIKNIKLKQSPKRRPVYFGREDRTFSMKELNLQIFLEDTRHNQQMIFDYTAITSNRNVILYLKEHDEKIRDLLSTQIEPIIPRLPIEDEGKSIIKDKIRNELNQLLKEEKIEGQILEIYIDYILGS